MRDVAHVLDDPAGLSLRARAYLAAHAVREPAPTAEDQRAHWEKYEVPPEGIELAVSFQERWGGLRLPDGSRYEGGPTGLTADMPRQVQGVGWCVEACAHRRDVRFGFYVDGAGRFGASWRRHVPLHGSIEGWIEARALEHAASGWDVVARRSGDVDGLAATWVPRVGPLTQVPEVRGLADTWWRGDGVMVWICSGEAQLAGRHSATQPEAVLYAVA